MFCFRSSSKRTVKMMETENVYFCFTFPICDRRTDSFKVSTCRNIGCHIIPCAVWSKKITRIPKCKSPRSIDHTFSDTDLVLFGGQGLLSKWKAKPCASVVFTCQNVHKINRRMLFFGGCSPKSFFPNFPLFKLGKTHANMAIQIRLCVCKLPNISPNVFLKISAVASYNLHRLCHRDLMPLFDNRCICTASYKLKGLLRYVGYQDLNWVPLWLSTSFITCIGTSGLYLAGITYLQYTKQVMCITVKYVVVQQ